MQPELENATAPRTPRARDGVVVLTGASAGIGAAAAVQLAHRGHRVLACGRSTEKLQRVLAAMRDQAPDPRAIPTPVSADFSSLAEVRRLAEVVRRLGEPVIALVNNAGIEAHAAARSVDGHELVFAVNHLAPFLLTLELASELRAANGFVVTTASSNHADGVLDLDDLPLRTWSVSRAYDRSKLANVLFTRSIPLELGLPASCFHPGSISTELNRESRYYRLAKVIERFRYARAEVGADTLVWLVDDARGATTDGSYFVDRRPVAASGAATDDALAHALWQTSLRLVGADTTADRR